VSDFNLYKELILLQGVFIVFKTSVTLRLVFPFCSYSTMLWWANLMTFPSSG